jgi:membrane-associated phospholipid phosphatase
VLVASVLVLAADVAFVSTGWLQALDGQTWLWFVDALGHQGFQIVEDISLAGVVKPSGVYLAMLAAVATALAAAFFVARRMPLTAGATLAAVLGCGVAVQLMKVAVNRSGPRLTPWTPLGHTFPSGTAAIAVAFFGFLISIALQLDASRDKLASAKASPVVVVLAGGAAAFVLSSSTYHYPSEVIGGVATGLAWLAVVWITLGERLRLELAHRGLVSSEPEMR